MFVRKVAKRARLVASPMYRGMSVHSMLSPTKSRGMAPPVSVRLTATLADIVAANSN